MNLVGVRLEEQNILIFKDEEGKEISFEIIEETKLVGVSYLLACPIIETDEEINSDEYDTALILREKKDEYDKAVYEIVEDDEEFKLIGNIFKELVEDIDFY